MYRYVYTLDRETTALVIDSELDTLDRETTALVIDSELDTSIFLQSCMKGVDVTAEYRTTSVVLGLN